MDGGGQVWDGRGTGIAGQALIPRETPMRPLCSGDHVLPGHLSLFLRWQCDSHRYHHGFGPHDFEPGAPNVRAWPISPQDGAMRKGLWRL